MNILSLPVLHAYLYFYKLANFYYINFDLLLFSPFLLAALFFKRHAVSLIAVYYLRKRSTQQRHRFRANENAVGSRLGDFSLDECLPQTYCSKLLQFFK